MNGGIQMLNYDIHVLQESDIPQLQEFERTILEEKIPEEVERQLLSWSAKWRPESMQHYLPLGWSFVVRDLKSKKIRGYFLAQPLLFLDGQTQSLWVEHVQCLESSIFQVLLEVAVKTAREKHFQKVYFKNESAVKELGPIPQSRPWAADVFQVFTTKVSV